MHTKFTKLSEITEALKNGATLYGQKFGVQPMSFRIVLADSTKIGCPKTAKNLTAQLTKTNIDNMNVKWTM